MSQAVSRSGGGVAADQRAPGQANAPPAIPLSARVRPGGHKNMPFDFPIPNYRASRSLDRSVVATLAGGDWIRNAQNLLITGATDYAT